MRCKICNIKFTPQYFLQKNCSNACQKIYLLENPPKRIKPISDKRKQQNQEYKEKRKEFLMRKENKFCAVFPNKRSVEIHHVNSRENERLNDEEFWLAISREGHNFIHSNPKEARLKKWLI